MEFYLALKKEENLSICSNMNGSGEHYAKLNKPVRERQIPHDFTHMWNQTNKLKKQNKDRLVGGEQMAASGSEGLGGRKIEPKGKRTHGHGQQCGDCSGLRGV